MKRCVYPMILALLGLPGIASAADAPALGSSEVINVAYLTKLGGAMVLVIALFIVTAWIMRNMGVGRTSKDGIERLQVKATLSVGNRERILLVEAAGDQVLIGVTQEKINTLHVIPAAQVEQQEAFTEALQKSMNDNSNSKDE